MHGMYSMILPGRPDFWEENKQLKKGWSNSSGNFLIQGNICNMSAVEMQPDW